MHRFTFGFGITLLTALLFFVSTTAQSQNAGGSPPAWIAKDIRPGAEIHIDQLGTFIANNLAIGETEKNLAGSAKGDAAPRDWVLSLRADLISRERGVIANFASEAVEVSPGGTYPASKWFRNTKAFNSALAEPLKPSEFVIFRIFQKTIVKGVGPKIIPRACGGAPYAVLVTIESGGNQFAGASGTGKTMALCFEGLR
jgi:hypothetical protein